MIGAEFLLSILTLVGGTYFGVVFGAQFKPYLQLVETFSVYLIIFNHEMLYVKSQKPAGHKLTSWNKFSLVRDYLLISVLRLALIPGIELALAGNLEQYDFVAALIAAKQEVGFSIGSLIIIIGFYGVLTNTVIMKFIIVACSYMLFARSAAIFEMHRSSISSTASIIEMVKLNTINGAYTLVATTVVDIFFRGNLTPLRTWVFIRSIFAAIPLVQIYYIDFGVAMYQQLFVQFSTFGKAAGIPVPSQLEDGFKVITLAICFYGLLFADIPERLICKLFS